MGSNKITKDNCLGTINPLVLLEWDYSKNSIDPYNYAITSNKKVWWKCALGHEWQVSIQSRTIRNHKCPYCSGYKASKENNLFVVAPKLMEEWDYLKNNGTDPSSITKGTCQKFWWKCKNNHKWEARVNSRTTNATGCPYCSNRSVNKDNCLATINPELAKEWHLSKNGILTPYSVVPMSSKKVWWKCSSGHEWQTVVAHRSNGRGCPYCNKIILKDGTACDSLVEAFYYLKFTKMGLIKNVDFEHNKFYCKSPNNFKTIGRIRYDFYFPQENKYLEVTSYNSKYHKWAEYMGNIFFKYQYVENILRAKFQFIQKELTREEIKLVRENQD